MALPRFLVDSIRTEQPISLPEAEAHHASRVLRLESGDSCILFDGQGNQAIGTVKTVEKRSVQIVCDNIEFAPRDHSDRLHFAIAMPKGDRQRNVIEKLVELGVDSLTLLETHRSVSKFDEDGIDKLRRYVMEACKQCQRNRLMRVEPVVTWDKWLKTHASQAVILHPKALLPGLSDSASASYDSTIIERNNFLQTYSNVPLPSTFNLRFAVGPEGGFTEEEIRLAIDHSMKLLDLGERILRVETAVSLAAVLGSLAIN